MPISITCESCGKKIKAPDDAGGKYGACPFCKHKCYIPLPEAEGEDEIKLAPIDESEEERYNRLMRETQSLTKSLLHEKEIPDDDKAARPAGPAINDKQVRLEIIDYLRLVAKGELDAAQSVEKKLKSNASIALDVLDQMDAGEINIPELSGTSPGLVGAFIKKLRAQLK